MVYLLLPNQGHCSQSLCAHGAAEPHLPGRSCCLQDRVPPGCSRYTVSLPKPLGLVLEEGKGGRGVYVVSKLAV